MKTNYRIGVWGQFGKDGCQVADGQAVKTRIIYDELQREYGVDKVTRVNTNQWKRNPLGFMFKSIRLIKCCKNIIIMPADNGFKAFVPLLWFVNLFCKRNIIYSVIGGFLPNLLDKHKWYLKILKTYRVIFAETNSLVSDLKKLGLTNVYYMPNFKKLKSKTTDDILNNSNSDVEIVYFSRITEDKGIADAANAIKLVNERIKTGSVRMDVYGLLPDDFKDRFESIISESQGFISYKGIVDYDKTVETIGKYFLLVFPTYFRGEGFPGCIIDAFNAGLPVIATDWMYNKDIIKNGHNGLIVPIRNSEKLAESILKLYYDRNLAYQFSVNNLEQAKQFSPEVVLQDLYSYID